MTCSVLIQTLNSQARKRPRKKNTLPEKPNTLFRAVSIRDTIYREHMLLAHLSYSEWRTADSEALDESLPGIPFRVHPVSSSTSFFRGHHSTLYCCGLHGCLQLKRESQNISQELREQLEPRIRAPLSLLPIQPVICHLLEVSLSYWSFFPEMNTAMDTNPFSVWEKRRWEYEPSELCGRRRQHEQIII